MCFLEHLVPLEQIEIVGDGGGDAVVALVHEAEEGEIADLVDEQRLHLSQTFEQPRGAMIGERGIEIIEQRLGIVEAAAVAVEPGFAQQPDGYSGLAVPGCPISSTFSSRHRKSRPASVLICALLMPLWRSNGKPSSVHRHGRCA